ncbi:hypothetical protein B7463_g6395, partial [Scytalidium lignicola]
MASITASRVPASGLATAAEISSTHPYTCNTCQVAFRNSELQRGHMRSDWHRYNLKRRVTSLPPISSEVFTEKVLQAQASSTAAATKAAYEKTCTACSRTYFSENAYQNHLGSQKHKANVLAERDGPSVADRDEVSSVMSSTFSLGEPTTINESIDSDAEEEFNEVIESMKKSNLKDVPPATRRPSRPHHSVELEKSGARSATASSEVTANGEKATGDTLNQCLFCTFSSPSLPLNVSHMERIHGMFIPEKNYLVNLEGLIGSLYEKIHEYHECLYCGKLKPSVFGLQTHMRDKGHCKIPFGTEDEQLEIGEFYDFTSTYSDAEEESDSEDEDPKRHGGVKLGARRAITTDDDEEIGHGDGWETDSSASSLDSADLTAVPLDQRDHQYEKLKQHSHHSHSDPRPHRNTDGWHSHAHKHAHAVFYDEYELHLPSGRTAGHRSLNRYFKQNLHNHPSPAEREQLAIEAAAADSDSEADDRVAGRNEGERGRAVVSRANGGLGMIGVSEAKKKEVQAVEKRSRKLEERERRKFQWGNNKQSNSQKHFRPSPTGAIEGAMAEQMGTPGSNADTSVNGTRLSAPKDKSCPFCHQAFTSSSLGRHLDLYIKEKNPKPADGIHDVIEIKKIRGGITRRQPRNSSAKREGSTPSGTPNAAEGRSPHNDGGNISPGLRRTNTDGSEMSKSPRKPIYIVNGATFETTGVINNIPATRNSEQRNWDGDSGDAGRRLDQRSRTVSRQMLAKSTFEQKQKMMDALDHSRAAELALRELFGAIRSSKQRIDGPSIFDYDPLGMDFPGLVLHCLPPTPTINATSPIPTPLTWSNHPPGEPQFEALKSHFKSHFHHWEISCSIANTEPKDDLSYPPQSQLHLEDDPAELIRRRQEEAIELEKQVNAHLDAVYTQWMSVPAERRGSIWTLELARHVGLKSTEIQKLRRDQELKEQEIAHLKLQVEELSRLQQPREFKLMPPSTLPITYKLMDIMAETGIMGSSVGFNLGDRNLHLDVAVERVIERWKNVVKQARSVGMASQKTLSAGIEPSTPDLSTQAQSHPQPSANATSNANATTQSTPDAGAMGSDQDAEGDAEMEDEDAFADMTEPAPVPRAPDAPMTAAATYRLTNGNGAANAVNAMDGLENTTAAMVSGYVRLG